MSQGPERKEKDCLNCNALIYGRYCHVCGQANIVTKQSALSMVKHFVYDIFHFDGKFFDTLRRLFFKPGFVPKEFVAGKRMSYLDPIRMYLFTSAVFFLFFFSMNNLKINDSTDWESRLNRQQRIDLIYDLKSDKNATDKSFRDSAILILTDSTYQVRLGELDNDNRDSVIHFRGTSYKFHFKKDTVALISDKEIKEGNWFKRTIAKIAKKYEDDPKKGMVLFMDNFLHRMPYLLFVSLPFFALLLKLAYLRRKQFIYHDHLIFTLYHYIFSFIVLLAMMGTSALEDNLGWSVFIWLAVFIGFYWLYYLYKSMRHFYQQSRGKTILKFLLINVFGFFLINVLFLIFLFITAIQL